MGHCAVNIILKNQLALDYCCTPEEIGDSSNHFTLFKPLEGRRRFREDRDVFLKIAVAGGKLLFTGQEDIVRWCREMYETTGSEWFLEAKNLRVLNDRLRDDGYQIEMMHPFFAAEKPTEITEQPHTLKWYEADEIETFRGDARFDEAFAFCPTAPDMLGAAALDGEKILGMAGASADSPTMWQIGINVDPSAEGKGIGTALVSAMKNELLRRGILPFYGTSVSHLASQRLAIAAGFLPAWAELITSRKHE